MKTYKLIKPIGTYPLVEYKQAKDKSYYNHHANGDATWIFIFSEIVENMPEYFVEVKEDWIDELIDRILPHIENSLETAEDYQWIREAIEKNMPEPEVIIKECNKAHIEHNPMPPHFCLPWCCCNKFGWLAPIPTVDWPTTISAGGMMQAGWPPAAIIKFVPCGCGCTSSEVCNCKGCTQKITI